MGTLAVETFLSLDGVMQGPGGPEEDRSGGFELGGWSVNYWDDVMGVTKDGQSRQSTALLLGRNTYEIFAAHWPLVTDPEDPMASMLNQVPKYVASTTLDRVDWNNSTLLEGDVPSAVAKLKDEHEGEIQVHGSWGLLQTLIAHDLIDEYRLWIFPVVLGTGKRLFGDGVPPRGLRLVDTTTSTTGVIMNTYLPAGPIQFGSFALDQ
jgi:dihydrofolate reductase